MFTSKNTPPGFYVYLYLREDGTPYYVGKGKNKRAWKKCKSDTVMPPSRPDRIQIVSFNLVELWAFALERRLIRWFGRIDNNTGILRNKTDGGEGSSGRKLSSSEIKRLVIAASQANKGKKLSDERKKLCVSFGPNHPLYNKKGCEHPLHNRKRPKNQVEKWSGSNNGMHGKTHSEDVKNALSKQKTEWWGLHKSTRSGVNHHNYDETVYTWRNKKTGQIIKMTPYQLHITHKINRSAVWNCVNGFSKSTGGWALIAE